ncbi:hypothetical protein F4678DRAFT_320761 [Xylaria arbuscula]|nr:hypothetical protein F4678DRAFT_320761 [Xylaria arbuscula]
MPTTIIHSATIFDGIQVHAHATIRFDSESGQISSISPTGSVPVPASTGDYDTVIDGTGFTIIPGLIDAHIHVHAAGHGPVPDLTNLLQEPLKYGITTVCDMHTDPETVDRFRQQVASELSATQAQTLSSSQARVTQSDLKSCLFAATVDGGWPKAIVLGPNPSPETKAHVDTWPKLTVDTVPAYVAGQKRRGADYIKLMQEDGCSFGFPSELIKPATQEFQRLVVQEARAAGFRTVAHATNVNDTLKVLEAGVDGLAHTIVDRAPTDELVAAYTERGAFVIPTLAILSSLTGADQDLRERFAGIAFDKGLLDEAGRDHMRTAAKLASPTAKIEYAYDSVKALKGAGMDIVTGTDAVPGIKGTLVGLSLWMELAQYVERCGMTPLEALRSATEAGARRLGFADRGTIEVGKRADLVMVKGEPHETLEHLWTGEGITQVWKHGFKAK